MALAGLTFDDPTSQKPPSISANDYKQLTQVEHILQIPDTYIGDINRTKRDEVVFNLRDMQFTRFGITVPAGLERIYLEILSNSFDNVIRSRQYGVPIGRIEIVMTATRITIKNGGIHIPVAVNTQTGLYAPEMIFGHVLTSSNYHDARSGCGRNGYGAKLTNIFSKFFEVKCGDPSNGLIYHGQWRNNMGEKVLSDVSPYSGEAFTEISFDVDLQRFGYFEGYDSECLALFSRHAADGAFTTKADVSFNGIDMGAYKSAEKYAESMFGSKNYIIYRQFAPGVKTVSDRNGTVRAVNDQDVPITEFVAVDTPNSGGFTFSFVNSMGTPDGGVHVSAAERYISNNVLALLNGKKKDTKINLKPADVKLHMSFILNLWVKNPTFSSQSKTKLGSPTPKFDIPESLVSLIKKWDVMECLRHTIDFKQFKESQKSDGGKKAKVRVDNARDAIWAGTAKSGAAVLYLCEGNSASSYVIKTISLTDEQAYKYGYFCLRGVPLNVMCADSGRVADNREICAIKQLLGLREGFDYSSEEMRSTLRYGEVRILADSDVDGVHICGLSYLTIAHKWPSLVMSGYVSFVRTPIVRAIKGKQSLSFYTEGEYEEWCRTTSGFRTYETNYFKGLGSSTDKNIKEDYENMHIVSFIHDEDAQSRLSLAFGNECRAERKEWISKYDPTVYPDNGPICTVSSFIDIELVVHAFENMVRCICGSDGLKPGQRKIVYADMSRTKDARAKKTKVAQLSGYVAQHTAYKHNEKCLSDTIRNMAQKHIGSNNLPYFLDEGQFGTRKMGGKDAADARYIFVRGIWSAKFVFRSEDEPIFVKVIEEGEEQEPKTFFPVIPLHMVNGCKGIGTGHSTFIPPFDPRSIVLWLKQRLRGLPLPPLSPWFRGYGGEIKTYISPKGDGVDKFTCQGSFEIASGGRRGKEIHVTELPIYKIPNAYEARLDVMEQKKEISSYEDHCGPESVHFIVRGMDKPTHNKLGLLTSHTMNNMVVLDEDRKPRRFTNSRDLIEFFFEFRLPHYQRRKDHIIAELSSEIRKRHELAAFMSDIVENKIVVFRQKRDYVYQQMDTFGHKRELFPKVKLEWCTEEYLAEYTQKTEALEETLKDVISTSAETMWYRDLIEFEKEYCKRMKTKPQTMDGNMSENNFVFGEEPNFEGITFDDSPEEQNPLDDVERED